jgi:hypothetical protein
MGKIYDTRVKEKMNLKNEEIKRALAEYQERATEEHLKELEVLKK